MGRITGDCPEGRAEGDSLLDKQMGLLSGEKAVILAYDNYQRGLTLQHQRGEHSSSATYVQTFWRCHSISLSS